ncbi:hypothetical protein MIND_01190600 [Mycena indigotica]|uniref:Uncharacterized protein n=1 Tax=Mycena indigotica TaxID=2126181 RepID=A0A8H6S7V3_9AGAR|nr:uncharacterized protein MIND_01190600 [Mycena indigotica]KAF7292915.1 hypothetical protein MIND_01190600 [Mycena indigotica]
MPTPVIQRLPMFFDGMEITEARPSTTHPTIQPERPVKHSTSLPIQARAVSNPAILAVPSPILSPATIPASQARAIGIHTRGDIASTSFFRSTTRPIPVIMVPSRRAPLVPAPSRVGFIVMQSLSTYIELSYAWNCDWIHTMRLDLIATRSFLPPFSLRNPVQTPQAETRLRPCPVLSRFNATTMEPKPRGPRKPLAAAPLQQVDSALNTADNQRNTRLLGYVGSVYLGHSMAVQEFYPDASNLAQFEQFLRAAQNWLNARPSDFPTVSDAVYDVFFSSMQDYISRSVTQIWTGYRTYMQSHLAPRLIAEADVHELLRGYQAFAQYDDNEEEEENFEDVEEEDGEGEMTDAVHSGGTIHVNPQGQVLEGEPPSGLINEEAKEHRKKFVLRHRPEHGGFTGRHLIFAIKTLLKYRLLSPVCPEAFEEVIPLPVIALSAVMLIHVLHTIVNPAVRFETSRYKMIYYVILELLEETWNHPVHGLALRRLSAKLVKALGKRKQQ